MMRFDKPANDPGKPEVTREDIEKIFRGSPHYTNKFFISVSADGMVRIAFADADDANKQMNVRTSVVLPAPAFVNLCRLLNSNLPNIQKMLIDMRNKLNETFPSQDQAPADKPVGVVIDGEVNVENLK